jgi:hypothetical protein
MQIEANKTSPLEEESDCGGNFQLQTQKMLLSPLNSSSSSFSFSHLPRFSTIFHLYFSVSFPSHTFKILQRNIVKMSG